MVLTRVEAVLCCFFDLDGTLVDSRRPILRSLNKALRTFGLEPVSPDQLHEFVGPPLHEQIPAYLQRIKQPATLSEPLIASFRADYELACVEMAELYPGVRDTVVALAEGCALAIVTSKPVRFAEPILDAVGLRQYFRVVEGIDPDRAEAKPTTLRRAMDHMNSKAQCLESVMIGDRLHDMAAGRDLGIRTIGVTWGHGTESELIAAGADTIARTTEELLQRLGCTPEGL
jgi:phosphoglycolate phosphatase